MTKAQEIYDKVEALVASGSKKADAFKQLAAEYEQPVNSMRGAYYAYSRGAVGDDAPRRTRKRETTPDDAVDAATTLLQKAIDNIDAEIAAAKARAEEAAAEYEAMTASADERKEAIQAKIDALAPQ